MKLVLKILSFGIACLFGAIVVSCDPEVPCQCTVYDQNEKEHTILGNVDPEDVTDLCGSLVKELHAKGIKTDSMTTHCFK